MKSIVALLICVFGLTCSVQAAEYNFISADAMKSKLEAQAPLIIVDIQVEKEFKQHHLPGSVATYAYPVKTEADRTKLDDAIKLYKETENKVVIVCPRGKGGAKRCFDYMRKNNIPAEKISILEKGIAGWPFKELTEKG